MADLAISTAGLTKDYCTASRPPTPAAWTPRPVSRLSIFDAFGSPYVEMPPLSGLLLVAGCAVAGTGLAALMARVAGSSDR